MTVIHWYAHHIVGWQVLLPAILFFGLSAMLADRRGRAEWIPWLFFVAWGVAVGGTYLQAGVGRFMTRNPALWAAMTATALVVTLIPLGLCQLAAYVTRRTLPRAVSWTAGTVLAIVALPITNVVSGVIGDLVLPHILHT